MESKSDKARRARLKRLYNISPEEYAGILAYQGGVCFLCEKSTGTTGKPKVLGVDHQHAGENAGLIRGILCLRCNRFLAEFWTQEMLERALEYISNPPAVQALGERRFGRKGRITNKVRKRRRRGSSH
ncbi:MAG: hypothetical protein KGL39_24490 [Patescibacteria group bacterium]|nr:hypothetical protein [Patescibacteria group bacterium]